MRLCKHLLAACTAMLFIAAPTVALSQTFPGKPVRVIVSFPPGTPNDFILRTIGESFLADAKQPLILDNQPGAGGNIGAEAVARAVPDGYTLLGTIDTVVTANPRIYKKLSFKADADLVPVIYLANAAQTLVCHPSVPVQSVAELIAYAKANPMNYASGGVGVPGHLAAELFLASTGVKMNHVPYKGPAPATQDVIAGHVACGFLATPVVMPHVKSGKLRGLGVTSARRSPIAPELPTIAEAGVPGYEATFGEMVLAPKGTPENVVIALNERIAKLLQRPDVRERMLAVDLEFVPNDPSQAAARLRAESEKWARVVDRLGLKVE
jgi:tripartite-type tricarboxylate transporter receptor subunit TctC